MLFEIEFFKAIMSASKTKNLIKLEMKAQFNFVDVGISNWRSGKGSLPQSLKVLNRFLTLLALGELGLDTLFVKARAGLLFSKGYKE